MKKKHVKIVAAIIAGLLALLLIAPIVLDVIYYSVHFMLTNFLSILYHFDK